MVLLLAALAAANEPLPTTQGNFLVPSRTDAPTDGVLLFEANFDVTADVVEGPGAPAALASTPLLTEGWGNGYIVSFAPPAGWEAGARYVVEVAPQTETPDAATATLAFTVGTAAAAPPSEPLVTSATAEPWSADEEMHATGCCHPVRRVSFEVAPTSDDPWAYVELTGLFEGETALTETAYLQRLDVGIGPGPHTLTYVQWDDGGVLQPPAFEVAAVSAGGVRGEPQRFELPRDEATEMPAPRLCGTPGAVALAPLGLAVLLVRRRRAS